MSIWKVQWINIRVRNYNTKTKEHIIQLHKSLLKVTDYILQLNPSLKKEEMWHMHADSHRVTCLTDCVSRFRDWNFSNYIQHWSQLVSSNQNQLTSE